MCGELPEITELSWVQPGCKRAFASLVEELGVNPKAGQAYHCQAQIHLLGPPAFPTTASIPYHSQLGSGHNLLSCPQMPSLNTLSSRASCCPFWEQAGTVATDRVQAVVGTQHLRWRSQEAPLGLWRVPLRGSLWARWTVPGQRQPL